MNTIASARKAAFESSARMIASGAENWYQTKTVLGEAITPPPACSAVAKITADIPNANCVISFDSSGTASVNITNPTDGKFKGCTVTGATKTGTVSATGGNCASS